MTKAERFSHLPGHKELRMLEKDLLDFDRPRFPDILEKRGNTKVAHREEET